MSRMSQIQDELHSRLNDGYYMEDAEQIVPLLVMFPLALEERVNQRLDNLRAEITSMSRDALGLCPCDMSWDRCAGMSCLSG